METPKTTEKIEDTPPIQEPETGRKKPKPSRTAITAIVIAIVILIASISAYIFFQEIEEEKRQEIEAPTVTYKQLCDDFDADTWGFESYKDGDLLYVQDTISSINCTDTLLGTYTNITFSSITPTNRDFETNI